MAGNAVRRILLLGATGVGKSSVGNTILGKRAFKQMACPSACTTRCVAEKTDINGKIIEMVDTPGFFGTDEVETENTDRTDSPDDQNGWIERSIVECSAGSHAVVIVLRVERFTKHQEETVEQITKTFTADVFKYAVVLFTHGYDLKGQSIKKFVKKNDKLQKLIDKCGGRCHVVDNEHWKSEQSGYKSNKTQVGKLLNTIEKLMEENGGKYYTNEFLKAVDADVQNEMESIKKECKGYLSDEEIREQECKVNMPDEEIREQAKKRVCSKITAAGCATGVLMGAMLGIPVLVGAGLYHSGITLKDLLLILSKTTSAAGAEAGARAGAAVAGSAGAALEAMVEAARAVDVGVAGIAVGVVGGGMIAAGAVAGGITGWKAAEGAESPGEASVMAKNAVIDGVKRLF